MESKDFLTIFDYFSEKIDQIQEIIPLVKVISLNTTPCPDTSFDNFEFVLKLSELPGEI